jgi:hypothetical protein
MLVDTNPPPFGALQFVVVRGDPTTVTPPGY